MLFILNRYLFSSDGFCTIGKDSLRMLLLEMNHALAWTGILASQRLQHNRVLVIRCIV